MRTMYCAWQRNHPKWPHLLQDVRRKDRTSDWAKTLEEKSHTPFIRRCRVVVGLEAESEETMEL